MRLALVIPLCLLALTGCMATAPHYSSGYSSGYYTTRTVIVEPYYEPAPRVVVIRQPVVVVAPSHRHHSRSDRHRNDSRKGYRSSERRTGEYRR
ncbi:MAG: hypothetical protein QG650_489 [Patescibacteria group bacterium]|nr:hypothetical protein [Patescibacteria group bacterium]